MKRLQILLIACTVHVALAGAGARAATVQEHGKPNHIAPGLWEMTTRLQTSDPSTQQAIETAQARLAALPTEQRQRIEQGLARRGVDLRIGNDALAARVCITSEMAERDAIAPQTIGNCRTERSLRSGDSVRFAAVCSEPRSTVDGITTFTSDKSFESRTTSTIELGGTTRLSVVEQSGRWIGADCGALGPASPAGR